MRFLIYLSVLVFSCSNPSKDDLFVSSPLPLDFIHVIRCDKECYRYEIDLGLNQVTDSLKVELAEKRKLDSFKFENMNYYRFTDDPVDNIDFKYNNNLSIKSTDYKSNFYLTDLFVIDIVNDKICRKKIFSFRENLFLVVKDFGYVMQLNQLNGKAVIKCINGECEITESTNFKNDCLCGFWQESISRDLEVFGRKYKIDCPINEQIENWPYLSKNNQYLITRTKSFYNLYKIIHCDSISLTMTMNNTLVNRRDTIF